MLKNNTVTISVVVSNGPGWLVVHAQADGKVGPDIGHTALADGLNKNVVVKLDPADITAVLYAMLHTDAGVVGTYEFPGADVPVTQSGNLVNKPFRLHSAAEAPVVGLELAAQGFAAPVALLSPEDGTARRFIVDQVGVIYILPKTGPMLTAPFLDLRSRIVPLNPNYDERGLLGLAFHRDFKTNGRFYVLYSVPLRAGAPAGFNCTTRVSEFKSIRGQRQRGRSRLRARPAGAGQAAVQSQRRAHRHGLRRLPLHSRWATAAPPTTRVWGTIPPLATRRTPPPCWARSCASTWTAKALRVAPTASPRTTRSPMASKGGPRSTPTVCATPILLTFDRGGDHELFVGMAGQNRWESFFLVTKGTNYGWRIREGSHCFDAGTGCDLAGGQCPKVGAAGEPLVGPILEYPNAKSPGGYGITAIGGRVYRGATLPHFTGKLPVHRLQQHARGAGRCHPVRWTPG